LVECAIGPITAKVEPEPIIGGVAVAVPPSPAWPLSPIEFSEAPDRGGVTDRPARPEKGSVQFRF
jgi:hypothetical protein